MVLVTGATGLLGSHLLFDLISKGENVKALKRENSSTDFVKKVFSYYSNDYLELFDKIIWVEGDVNDIYSLINAFADVNHVYHTAAVVSFNHSELLYLRKVNAEGTANIVNICLQKGIKKLCYTSSVAALGREDSDVLINEESPWYKNIRKSAYSETKYEAEQEVWRGIAEGLNAVMVNPSIIIGPGNWKKGSSKLFESVWKGQKFYTKGINGFVDVRDVSKAMIELMNSNISNERFIVSSENLSYQTVLTEIAANLGVNKPKYHAGRFLSSLAWRFEFLKSLITGAAPLITKETAYTAHNKHLYKNDKIKNVLPFNHTSISEAIAHTASIFLKEHKK